VQISPWVKYFFYGELALSFILMTGLFLKLFYFTPNKQEEIHNWLIKQAQQNRQTKKSFMEGSNITSIKRMTHVNTEILESQLSPSQSRK
jgi:hypothetical protein